MRLKFLRNTYSRVPDNNFRDTPALFFSVLLIQSAADAAPFSGILYGITQNIQTDFRHMGIVQINTGVLYILCHAQLLVLFLHRRLKHHNTGIQHLTGSDNAFLQYNLIVFNSCQLQDTVDNGKQLFS